MKPSTLFLFVLAVIACTVAQSEDELHIPVETDNQFPPDNHVETDDLVDGSGAGAIEEPIDEAVTTEASPSPIIEDVQLPVTEEVVPTAEKSKDTCPKPCVCHIEGESNVVDCSGYDLKEFPASIDTKTTILNIQNNKLTEIPKDISLLKNLKVLNAGDNLIMDLASGSISELPELTVLKLGNNRLIEYPKDLKNGFGLTKLEELDLGGNDMRTSVESDIFSHFTSLKKLTLPTSTKEMVDDLCSTLRDNLVTVCTETCSLQSFECPEAPEQFGDDLMDVVRPGAIAVSSIFDNSDPVVPDNSNVDTTEASGVTDVDESSVTIQVETAAPSSGAEFSLRSAVNKAPEDISSKITSIEAPKEVENDHKETDVAVGATTSGNKSGGVDKSVIGIIVAGMVLVVAGITIKKNWTSIKNRFSSTPRAANERPGGNANGTAPEEVPLQEKSPV